MRSLAILLVALAACRTTTESAPAHASEAIVSRALPVEAWELREQGGALGTVLRYVETGDSARSFFSVRDPAGHELGMIDAQGRAWRYRPHRREPEWVGTGTVLRGARAILGGGTASALAPIELPRPASGR
jgi:hypothetical protein